MDVTDAGAPIKAHHGIENILFELFLGLFYARLIHARLLLATLTAFFLPARGFFLRLWVLCWFFGLRGFWGGFCGFYGL